MQIGNRLHLHRIENEARPSPTTAVENLFVVNSEMPSQLTGITVCKHIASMEWFTTDHNRSLNSRIPCVIYQMVNFSIAHI